MKRKIVKLMISTAITAGYLAARTVVHAADDADAAANAVAFEVGGITNLLWQVVATIKWLAVPITAISLSGIGVGVVMSGDDSSRKSSLKGLGTKILIGGTLVFSAATIAQLLEKNLSNVGNE